MAAAAPENVRAASSTGDDHRSSDNHRQNESINESPALGTPSSDKVDAAATTNKGKTCKGCLYYSSTFKSNSRNPLCVGLTRSFPNVPRNVMSKSEVEASQAGSSLENFKYGCIGYSAYSDRKGHPGDDKEPAQLPICVGVEILVDRRVKTATPAPASAPVRNKEGGSTVSQPRPRRPAQPIGDEFLTRFKRNANLVAMGVVKNARKVGNRVKESVDDILYPYRRRPK